MTPEELDRLLDAFRRTDEDIDNLSDVLYLHKVRVYEDTLSELLDAYGYESEDVQISQDVASALSDESDQRAEQIIDTFNRDLERFARSTLSDDTYDNALARLEGWANDRDASRAQLIAVTEAYSAHADATIAFFSDNGIDVEFDFGEHAPDAPAACPICQALERANPHPMDRVLEVGNPHPQCRQSWHPRIDPADLPDEVVVGSAPAGIVGKDSLITREGGVDAAVESLEASTDETR